MMPSSNQGVGMNIGFPDVCLTPAAPSPIPVPYPNLGQNAVGMPFCPTILLSFCPAHNMGAKPMLTNGDEAGAAHATFIGTGANNMGNPRILLQGMPAETLCNPTAGNKYNNPIGAKLVPSVTNCLMGACPGEGPQALAAEMLDAPSLPGHGLTLERERGGWRVLHARRGGRASRAGVRAGQLVLGGGPGELVVRQGRATRALALPGNDTHSPVLGRLLPGGLGLLVVRRCSFGAPGAAARALRALQAAGARAWLLDLRGNPGGDLRVAASLAGLFLEGGALGHAGELALPITPAPGVTSAPLVVLVDGGTASAAELLAAALREQGRALLAGSLTFGKTLARAHRLDHAGLRPLAAPLIMRGASGARLAPLQPELGARAGLALARRRARERAA